MDRPRDGLLTLTDGAFWFGNHLLGSRLMVRSCYTELYSLMQKPQHTLLLHNWIVTGNPGIGKTFFSGYAMWATARQGRMVVWEPPPPGHGERYLLRPDGTVIAGRAADHSFADVLSDPETLFVADSHGPTLVRARTLIVTSPRKSVYHEYYKQHSPNLCYMPVWTLDELLACRRGCYPQLSEAAVADQFGIWGGVPREVLFTAPMAARQAFINQAIDACNVEACVLAVGQIHGPDDIAHRAIHIMVVDDGTYLTPRLRFASEYVASKLLDRFATHERSRVLNFLRAAEVEGSVTGLRGHLFKHWAHRTIAAGGTFRMRDLRTGNETRIILPRLATEVFLTLSALAVQPGRYYRPWQRNLAAVDALALPLNGPALLLQMTVGSTHPTKAAGVEAVLEQLHPGTTVSLVFAVTENQYDDFEEQVFVGQDNRHLPANARLQLLTAIPQFVLLVPLFS